MKNRVLVLGSSNVDLILRIPKFHEAGETIRGENMVIAFGGKGANQAISAKRAGAKVSFVTKLGADHYGQAYRRHLVRKGLDPRHILTDRKAPTGIALIELTPRGENRIIVSPGANHCLSEADVKRLSPVWKGVGIFVTQLEIPLATVKKGLEMAKAQGSLTILNPSPAEPSSSSLLSLVDVLVANQWEARSLTGLRVRDDRDIRKVARRLMDLGSKNVVITLGSQGLFFINGSEEIRMKAFRVRVVDTTAAGDAFIGVLAYGFSEDRPVREALRLASVAGALATMRLGAQPSLPSKREMASFLSGMRP